VRALPKWLTRERKVRGPTLSLRISRSQSIRCASVSVVPGVFGVHAASGSWSVDQLESAG
jgi:hypothetical protein